MDVESLQKRMENLFPQLLGIRLLEVTPERVRATMEVREDLCTVPGVLHGGAIISLADTLGAVGTVVNLRNGAQTTTIESKTNFFAAARTGEVIEGETIPLHRGRRTMVWQTRICSSKGRLLALVTQTQAVLEAEQEPSQAMASLFAGKSADEQERLLAILERAGAGLYRALAEGEKDTAIAAELLRAAEREDANASALERITQR